MSTVTLWLLCTYLLTYIFYAAGGGEYNPKRFTGSLGNFQKERMCGTPTIILVRGLEIKHALGVADIKKTIDEYLLSKN